ncbi:MAG TPA: hypothetical protein VNI83_02135 [Vicinamibacterales bacterium]|nr:hypothetical protein [Vicinamibacterales bacterium]
MFDNNLVLDAGQTVTNEAQTTAKEVEGGVYALLCVKLGTLAANGDALNIRLQYQPDGTNWYTCPGGRVEQVLGIYDNMFIRQPVFIPTHDTKGSLTKVRLDYELSENATESFQITKAWLEPLLSLGDIPVDRAQAQGLYADMPKGTVSIP